MPNALAGLASLLWGTADFLGGFAAARWRAERVALVSQTIGLVLIGVLAPVLTGPVAPTEDLLWGAGAGASGAFGAVLLYRALSIGPMNAAAPTIAVVTAIVPALVGFAQGERPSTLAVSGVVVGVVAVAMIGGASGPGPGEPRATPRVLAMSALSGIGLGLANACFAQTAEGSGLWPVVATKVVAFFLIGVFVLVTAASRGGRPRDASERPVRDRHRVRRRVRDGLGLDRAPARVARPRLDPRVAVPRSDRGPRADLPAREDRPRPSRRHRARVARRGRGRGGMTVLARRPRVRSDGPRA